MTELNSISGKYSIKGNQPLLVNNSQIVWVVKSGALALFATLLEAGEPKGNRSYLFSLKTGEGLFGAVSPPNASTSHERGIIAVPLEETELEQLSLTEVIGQIAQGNSESIALLEGWVKQVEQLMAEQPIESSRAVDSVRAEDSHYLSLLEGQILVPQKHQVNWVDVRQGETCCMGTEEFNIDANSPIFPLAPSMWLEAKNPVEVYITSVSELENFEQLSASLEQLHRYFFEHFDLQQQQQLEAEFQRFQERAQLNRQAAETAVGQLTTLLNPRQDSFLMQGDLLLIAAGAVGRAMGIKVSPPGRSEDLERVKEPLEAIARASQFRIRRVLLADNWWREEHGALLAYTASDKKPVALLPYQGNNYLLFEPESRTRTPVDAEVAETLALDAYTFYRPLPLAIANAAQIFLFGSIGHQKDILAIFILGIVGSLIGMVVPQATAVLINNAIPDSDRLLLFQIGLALFAAALGQSAFQIAQSIMSLRVETAADASLQPGIWDRLLKLSPRFFREYSSGDLLTRVMAIGQIRSQISGTVQRTLLSGLFALLNLGLMLIYSVELSLVSLGITLLVIGVSLVSSRLLVPKQRQQEEIEGQINGLTVELINGVAKLRVAAAEERAFAAWVKKYRQRMKLQVSIQQINDGLSVFNDNLSLLSKVLIFWFAVLFLQMAASRGGTGLNMGTFLAFNAAFGTFLGGAVSLSNTSTDILEIVALWQRARPILDTPPESDPTKANPGVLSGQVTLDHITFRYKENGPMILDDVSFAAEPGEFIAFVGPSGSGKSTIFRLLLGFETSLSGSVYFDGQDLAGLDVVSVRRQLGVVLQNVRVTSASIFDIIASGALITLDEAWEAARMAGFASDIQQMPMGMHTVISEGGTNLSGGQRQRLMIARALALKPKIILLDEATSALDNQTQAIVTESLARLNATRIVIAHRLSTIRDADRIYVVEAGRIVQQGTFTELLAQEGLFAKLASRQLD